MRASMYKFCIVVPREAIVARDEHIRSASIHVDAQVLKRAFKRDVRTAHMRCHAILIFFKMWYARAFPF